MGDFDIDDLLDDLHDATAPTPIKSFGGSPPPNLSHFPHPPQRPNPGQQNPKSRFVRADGSSSQKTSPTFKPTATSNGPEQNLDEWLDSLTISSPNEKQVSSIVKSVSNVGTNKSRTDDLVNSWDEEDFAGSTSILKKTDRSQQNGKNNSYYNLNDVTVASVTNSVNKQRTDSTSSNGEGGSSSSFSLASLSNVSFPMRTSVGSISAYGVTSSSSFSNTNSNYNKSNNAVNNGDVSSSNTNSNFNNNFRGSSTGTTTGYNANSSNTIANSNSDFEYSSSSNATSFNSSPSHIKNPQNSIGSFPNNSAPSNNNNSINNSNNTSSNNSGSGLVSTAKTRCSQVMLGNASCPRGLRVSSFSPSVCDSLLCSHCNFKVQTFVDVAWDASADYLFLRNNMPNRDKLAVKLLSSSGSMSYCCQCRSTTIGANEEKKNVGLGAAGCDLPWICTGHNTTA